MALTNITSTASNGTRICPAQAKTTGQVCTGVDETLVITGSINTSGTTASVTLTNCNIHTAINLWLTTSATVNTDLNGNITLRGCRVQWNAANARVNAHVRKILGTTIRATRTGTGGTQSMYTQGGGLAEIDSYEGNPTVFDGIYVHEIIAQPLKYQNAIYQNCGLNILNREAGDLKVRDVSFGSGTIAATAYTGADGVSYTTFDGWIGNGNAANVIRYYDCTINLSKIAINRTVAAGNELAFKYFSRTERYITGTTPEAGLKLRFTPTASSGTSSQASFDMTTLSTGLTQTYPGNVSTPTVDLMVQSIVATGATTNTGLPEPSTRAVSTLKNITWKRRWIDYSVFGKETDVTPTKKIGVSGNEINVYLDAVPYLTLTEAQAGALTGISIVASGSSAGTVTISANTTVSNLWHYWRWWISQWSAYPAGTNDTWTYDGSTLNMGGWSLVVNTGITLSGNVTTSSTITRNGTAIIDGSFSDSSGSTYKFTVIGVATDSEVRCYSGTNPATSVEIAGIESSSGDFVFYQKSSGQAGYIQIHHVDYQMVRIPITWPSSATSLPVQQIKDRQYNRGTVYVPG